MDPNACVSSEGDVSDKKNVSLLLGLTSKDHTIAGRYRVVDVLGVGPAGFVVSARHLFLRQKVTLKIFRSATGPRELAQRRLAAAHTAAVLRGPHMAHVLDTGFTEDGSPFIVMEHFEGRTLADELSARGTLPADEAVRWVMQACIGLAEVHAGGLVHADLKPSNLFLADDDRQGRLLKVLDVGMITAIEETADDGNPAWFASPAYFAPEQIQDPHALDPRVDVWALAVILHQSIAGALPFFASTISGMLLAVTDDEPALLAAPDVPYELAHVIQTCLSKNPAERPQDASALAHALAPFAGPDGPKLAEQADAMRRAPPTVAMRPRVDTLDGFEHQDPALASTPSAPLPFPKPDEASLGLPVMWWFRGRVGAMLALVTATVAFWAMPRPDGALRDRPTSAAAPSSIDLPVPPDPEPTTLEPVVVESGSDVDEAPTTPPPKPPTILEPALRVRSSLIVRENPYSSGFTHPKRLPEPHR